MFVYCLKPGTCLKPLTNLSYCTQELGKVTFLETYLCGKIPKVPDAYIPALRALLVKYEFVTGTQVSCGGA